MNEEMILHFRRFEQGKSISSPLDIPRPPIGVPQCIRVWLACSILDRILRESEVEALSWVYDNVRGERTYNTHRHAGIEKHSINCLEIIESVFRELFGFGFRQYTVSSLPSYTSYFLSC